MPDISTSDEVTSKEVLSSQNREPGQLESIPDAFLFPIGRIVPMRAQPRSEFDQSHIQSIASSIKENQGRRVAGTGIIHPLLVRWEAGAIQSDGTPRPGARVEIVAGENRYMAAKLAELEFVPVIVTDQDSESAYEDALTENILRGDLSAADEGRAFQFLMNKHGIGIRQLALRLFNDKSRKGYIESRLTILNLNPIVRVLVDRRADSITAARRIQSIANEDTQRELVQEMLDGATFAQINKKIQQIKGIVPAASKEERENRRAFAESFPTATPATTAPESRVAASSILQQLTSAPVEDEPATDNDAHADTPFFPEEQHRFGTPQERGVRVMPSIDVPNALDSLAAQMEALADALEPVNLHMATRRRYAPKVERIESAFAKVRFNLDTQ